MPKVLNYKIIIEQDEDGKFVASVPSIPGCYTEGDTYEKAIKNIKEAIELCLEVAKEDPNYASKINPDGASKFLGVTEVTISA
jgi:predicted RNase H-like HicB family nuclease